jgi:hypothetical protein
MRVLIVFVLAVCSLAGCANLNSGKIDFRRATPLRGQQPETLRTSHISQCWKVVAEPKVTNRPPDGFSPCAGMLPTTLSDKNYAPREDLISANDVYSIRLDFGRIQYLGESFGGIRVGSFLKPRPLRQQGEIAVLVNAFEFAAQGTSNADSPRFYSLGQNQVSTGSAATGSSASDYSSARVVYFSPDVLEGQSLNFSNIPITAPQKYHGRPIGVQIIVVELDRLSDSTKSLMKGLADLGRTTLGASGATDTLLALGKSLLDGANDDVIFEYRFVMDNGANLNGQTVSPFTAGRYVFRRAENRNTSLIWSNLRLDENTGELFLAQDPASQPQAFKPYVAETYFTLSVIKHGQNGIEANYEATTWREASSRFDAFLNAQTSSTLGQAAVTQEVTTLLDTRNSLAALSSVNEKISRVTTAWTLLSRIPAGVETDFNTELLSDFHSFSPEDKERCRLNWLDKRRSALLLAQDAQAETLRMAATWTGVRGLLDPQEDVAIERFRTSLNNALGPEPPNDRIFEVPTAFKSTFVTAIGGPELLSRKLQARATLQQPVLSCATLAS